MADEGARTAGLAAGRAAMILGIGVLVGLLLLNSTDADVVSTTRTTVESPGSDEPALPGEDEVPDDTTPSARPPGEVKVLVANATRTEGLAGKVTEKLRLAGYNVVPPTDAPKEDASVIHFASGYEVEAQIVAQALELPPAAVQPMPTPPPLSDLRGAHLLVLAGPELANTGATTTTAAGGAGGTTTTTSG
jgi:hypothetical protein